ETRLPETLCDGGPRVRVPRRRAGIAPRPGGEGGPAVRGAVLRRIQRVRRVGHDLPDGPERRRRHQPALPAGRHPDEGHAQVRPDRQTRDRRDEQRGLLRRVRPRAARAERPRLLGEQPLARGPVHGDREAGQLGV
ncbi:MAG: hypothetical protein AVDCRST_MAG64-2947, partial [uncultured Phycisphaerae bacterium]